MGQEWQGGCRFCHGAQARRNTDGHQNARHGRHRGAEGDSPPYGRTARDHANGLCLRHRPPHCRGSRLQRIHHQTRHAARTENVSGQIPYQITKQVREQPSQIRLTPTLPPAGRRPKTGAFLLLQV